jgi:DNA-binding transcriptional MocR family regulator
VVQPTLHNPTTAGMPLERRREIARLAQKYDLLVIEDDTAGGMLMDRPPPIASFAPDHTIYVTSISKCLSPALRLGYIAAPRGLVERLERVLHALSLGAPPLVADVMSVLLSSGSADRIVAMNLEETTRRQAVVAEALSSNRLRTQPGAFFAWLALPPHWRAQEFVAAALREGVNVTDGDNFLVDRTRPVEAVRISVDGTPGHEVLRRGLGVLSRLLQHHPDPGMVVV